MHPYDLKMTRGGVEYDAKAIERVRARKRAAVRWLVKSLAEADYQSVEMHKREVDDAHDILSAWEKRLARRKPQGLPA